MARRRAGDTLAPMIRVAPLGDLNIYAVTEYELDELASGSPASLQLNLCIFFSGTWISLLVALCTTTIPDRRMFDCFVVAFFVTLVASLVLGLTWHRSHSSTKRLIAKIKARMPPTEAFQEAAPTIETGEPTLPRRSLDAREIPPQPGE